MAQILMNGFSVPFEKGTILNNYSQATGFQFVTEIQFESADLENDEAKPTIAGYGEGLFEIGEELYRDKFEDETQWVIQVQDSDADTEPFLNFGNGHLEILMPDRGATIWHRNKFIGPVAITYKVKASSENVHRDGIVVRISPH